MPLFDLLAASAARFPEKTSLIFPAARITFGDLYRQSRQVAVRLRKLGIGPGARVAILYENALAAVTFFWGILGSGAGVVDIPSLAKPDTIEEMLAESKPAAIVLSAHQARRLSEAEATSIPEIVLMEAARAPRCDRRSYHLLPQITATESPDAPLPALHETSVALVIYTSGTTGWPKGVMLSHRNLLSNIAAANSLVGVNSEDSILVVVPLHFIHGRMQLITHMMTGSTMAFSEGFHFPQRVVDDLERYRVTSFSGTPYHFNTLLDRTDLKKRSLDHLRYVLITGGAMAAERIGSLAAALPGVAIHVAYGQTEASPRVSYLGPLEVLRNPESSGRPLPGVLVEIVGDDGSELPRESIGQVVVSGANVMCGYVSGDEFSSGKIDAFGRLHTGDIGRLGHDGHLYLAGRKSDLIKCAGERVFPAEVERVLRMHPAVRESAVLGIPDEILGERIVACVVLQTGALTNTEELRSHCLKFLPLVRAPREIRLAESLPKTESGKIERRGVLTLFHELAVAHAGK
jgi:long-chain acyl-CoA synthetase